MCPPGEMKTATISGQVKELYHWWVLPALNEFIAKKGL
jgi:hypothetical protein